MYRLLDAVTIRATAIPPPPSEPACPDLATASAADLRAWMCRMWQDAAFTEAVEHASPSLAARAQRLCASEGAEPAAEVRLSERRLRRAAVSVLRYRLRTSARPTPTGLFAGVAPVCLGARTTVWWDGNHQVVARPDARWLASFADTLDPLVGDDCVVVAATTARVRGNRLVLPWLPGSTEPTQATPVSVRHTPAVAAVMAAARTPRRLGAVAAELCVAFPDTDPVTVAAMLAGLVRHRFLVTATRPPLTATDPLGYLLAGLPESGHNEARRAHGLLAHHNQPATTPVDRRALRRAAVYHLGQAVPDGGAGPVSPRLALDTRLDARLSIAPTVARAAEDTVAALAALAAHPTGAPEWVDYRARCLETYGPGAVVALEELTGAAGLGLPAGYRGSHLPLPPPLPSGTDRDRKLAELAYSAVLDGTDEVVVDAALLSEFSAMTPQTVAPPHVELRAQLHAATARAVDTGEFALWVTGVSRGVGTLTGRFAHLNGMIEHLWRGYHQLASATVTDGALVVQVSAPPLVETAVSIARTPPLLPHVLAVDEMPPEPAPQRTAEIAPENDAKISVSDSCWPRRLRLDGLAVRIEPDRLLLLHRPTGRFVEPALFSALEPRWHTHPLVRFCCELPRAHTPPNLAFAWPAATRGWVFLPRVRTERAILAPAQWRLRATDLPGPDADPATWADGLARLRERRRIPDRVHLLDGERYLRLDLEQAAHRHLLRLHLDHQGQNTVAVLTETPPTGAWDWCGGRTHELVLPVAATTVAKPPPALDPIQPPPPARGHQADSAEATTTSTAVHLPGAGTWLALHLYTDPDLYTALLLDHVAELWQQWGTVPAWWFVRYRDHDGPHLRVRIRVADGGAAALPLVGQWAQDLRRARMLHRMTVATYRPETGRYGHGLALAAAEELFVADSDAARAELTHLRTNRDVRSGAVCAASLTDLACAAFPMPEQGRAWMVDRLPRPAEPIDRADRAHALRLIETATNDAVLGHAWWRRAAALDAYRSRLHQRPAPTTIAEVVPSLLHMHHNRLMGPDRDTEHRGLALARTIALAHRACVRTPA